MPRIRDAIRSAWKTSKSAGFSPIPTKRSEERGAAAGVAVELGQDDPVEPHRLVEGEAHVDGLLAGHGVRHQERLGGPHRLSQADQLPHQLGIDLKPSGGIQNDDVAARLAGLRDRGQGDLLDRALAAEEGDLLPLREDPQLVDRGRAPEVECDQRRPVCDQTSR